MWWNTSCWFWTFVSCIKGKVDDFHVNQWKQSNRKMTKFLIILALEPSFAWKLNFWPTQGRTLKINIKLTFPWNCTNFPDQNFMQIGSVVHPNKQTEIISLYIFIDNYLIVLESSFALNINFPSKSQSIQLRTYEPSWKHSLCSTEYPMKIWGKSVKGLLSYDRAYKQTEIIYICIIYRKLHRKLIMTSIIQRYGYFAYNNCNKR